MPNVLGRKLFKKQSSRGKGITSMLEDFPQGFAEGGEVTSPAERKRLAMDMLARAREEGFSFLEEGERPSLTRQAAVGGAPAMGPDPRAAQQLAMMQQLGMMPPRFQEGGMADTSMFRRTMNALRGDMVIVDPRTGEPIQFIDPTNPIDVAGETALTTLVPGAVAARGIGRLLASRRGRAAPSRMEPAREPVREQGELFRGPSGESRLGAFGEAPAPRTSVPAARPAQGELFPDLVVPVGPGGASSAGRSGIPSIPLSGMGLSGIPRTGAFRSFDMVRPRAPELPRDNMEIPETALRDVPVGDVRDPFEERQQAGFEGGRAEAMRDIPRREEPETKKETPPPPAAGGDRSGVSLPSTSGIDVLIEDIKARREGLRAARDENKAMALIQAGLAIASGRSANALSNIGAGGLAGIQALREGERDIRREQRELSGDEMRLALAREQAAAERAYREATLGLSSRELDVRSQERKESAAAREAAQKNALARETGNMLRLTVQNIDTQLNNLRKNLPITIEPRERSALEAEILGLQQQRSEALQQYRGILGQLGVQFPEPQPGANAFPGFSAKPVAPPK